MSPKSGKAHAAWSMCAEQRDLLPGISGNEINGLGEAERRRPEIVYWPNDSLRAPGAEIPKVSEHPYGPVINWFRRRSAPEVRDAYMDFDNRAPAILDEISPDVVEDSAESWTARVKEFVLANEGELVGIPALRSEWFYNGENPAGPLSI